MRMFSLSFLLVALLTLTGCYCVDFGASERLSSTPIAGEPGKVEGHLLVQNCGWYLFHCIPLVCGNTNEDSWFPWVFFRNETDSALIEKRFAEKAEELGCRAVNVSVINDDTVTMDVPGFDFPVIVAYILCFRDTEVSGVLVK